MRRILARLGEALAANKETVAEPPPPPTLQGKKFGLSYVINPVTVRLHYSCPTCKQSLALRPMREDMHWVAHEERENRPYMGYPRADDFIKLNHDLPCPACSQSVRIHSFIHTDDEVKYMEASVLTQSEKMYSARMQMLMGGEE